MISSVSPRSAALDRIAARKGARPMAARRHDGIEANSFARAVEVSLGPAAQRLMKDTADAPSPDGDASPDADRRQAPGRGLIAQAGALLARARKS